MASKATRRPARPRPQRLEFFRWYVPLSPWLSRQVAILGIKVPVAGIALVCALALVAFTVWGIVFSRAPRNITQQVDHRYNVAEPAFIRSMGVLLGPPLARGNRAQALVNGDEIFPAMLT